MGKRSRHVEKPSLFVWNSRQLLDGLAAGGALADIMNELFVMDRESALRCAAVFRGLFPGLRWDVRSKGFRQGFRLEVSERGQPGA